MWGLLLTPAATISASLIGRRTKQRFLLSILLAPLIRLISLSMPLTYFPPVYWYAILGVPLSVAVFLAVRRSGLDAAENG